MKWSAIPRFEIAFLLMMLTPVSIAAQAKDTSPKSQTGISGSASSSGEHDDIRVHGHWTIVVRNTDGSVASRNEFENALSTGAAHSGSDVISSLLSRNAVAGTWMVMIDGNQEVCARGNSPSYCWIAEPGSPTIGGNTEGTNLFSNLTMQRPTSGSNAYAIVLSGTAKATYTGNIVLVNTTLAICSASQTPAQCKAPSTYFDTIGNFSTRDLSTTPINIQAGQSIDVTVVLSFS